MGYKKWSKRSSLLKRLLINSISLVHLETSPRLLVNNMLKY